MNSSASVSEQLGKTRTGHPDPIGWLIGSMSSHAPELQSQRGILFDLQYPCYAIGNDDGVALVSGRDDLRLQWGGTEKRVSDGLPVLAFAPRQKISQLGDPEFCADHKVRFAYMTGAMANGIASVELVTAMGKAGLLGSFGAAGLRLPQLTEALDRLEINLGDKTFAVNLIHTPNEPAHEMAVVDLYLRRGIKLIEAAAFMDLTLPAVKYRTSGIHQDEQGNIVTPHRIIAKVSRIEVATKWFSPPPTAFLEQLVKAGELTSQQAELAQHIPMAQDLTAEADSAGHTDNRPAITLLPTMLALRDRLQEQFSYAMKLRVGLGGGIGTPTAAAAAFAMGAAYIVTGSVNQACVESGTCDYVRQMLAQTQQADVTMAPAADMFEMGVKLQVIKRGTMFPMRAAKLFELYRNYSSLETLPAAERQNVEKTIFRDSLENIWQKTREFFMQFDAQQVERAEKDSKHKMALVFRWYLGLASRWANAGDQTRQMDYQIWCGPAMGAFNEWTKGSFMADPTQRRAVEVACNLLYGSGVVLRCNQLRSQGVPLTPEVTRMVPQALSEIEDQLL